MWETTYFLTVIFKMAGELAEHIILFASWHCGSQTFQKTSMLFGSYFCSTLKQKALPARRAGTKQGGQSALNDISLCDSVSIPGFI
jgi:hypothetical protein